VNRDLEGLRDGVLEVVARLVGGCVWGLIALVGTVVGPAFYLAPFWALWWWSVS
jgi:hypothetical protein